MLIFFPQMKYVVLVPPSVFVGSYGYPKVGIGPMLPPVHGDTTLLDAPERWLGKSLEEIVNYRLNLVRGIRKAGIEETTGRFIESLHELAMSSGSIDSEIEFSEKILYQFHLLMVKMHLLVLNW